jgi:hypothetical protein
MLMLSSAARAGPPILKQEPPPAALTAVEVVLVDYGIRHAGQIKQVTGGSNFGAQGMPVWRAAARLYRCIPK